MANKTSKTAATFLEHEFNGNGKYRLGDYYGRSWSPSPFTSFFGRYKTGIEIMYRNNVSR